MEVRVLVTLQAEPDDPEEEEPDPSEMVAACVEAILNAVQFSEDNGFVHRLANSVSIGVVSVGEQD